MTTTPFFHRVIAAAAVSTLAFGFAAAPVSLQLTGYAPSLKETQAFARKGADDPAGHIRKGRGRDDAPGDDRGGVRGGGKDDKAGDDHGGKERGGRGRGGHDDGPGHK